MNETGHIGQRVRQRRKDVKRLLSLLPSLSGQQLPGILKKECICIFVPKISYLKLFLFYILLLFFFFSFLRIDFLVGKQHLENIVLWPSSQCVCRKIQSHPVALWLVPFRKLHFVACVMTFTKDPLLWLVLVTLVNTRNLYLSSLFIFSWAILRLTSFPPPSFSGSVFWYYTHINWFRFFFHFYLLSIFVFLL